MPDNKHKNYEILNLIGYGLAKFDIEFVHQLGFKTKQAFFESIVESGIAETVGTVKNRQDLFDPFFDNGRKGWWQKGDAYLHRKKFIDSLLANTMLRLLPLWLSCTSKVTSIFQFWSQVSQAPS